MNITLINDLIDQHGDTFTTCEGCSICSQIQSLRGKDRTPEQKYKHILDKGDAMTFSDIAFLKENKVDGKIIAKKLGMGYSTFNRFIRESGIKGRVDNVCMEVEEYQRLKEEGLTDNEIAKKIEVTPSVLRNWKYKNGIKAAKVNAPREQKKKKVAEYESLIAQLKEKLSEKEEEIKVRIAQIEDKDKLLIKLNNYIEEKEDLNAACDDVESESASLREERDSFRTQLLDTRHELISLDAKHEELKHNFDNVAKTAQNLAKENEALKTLVGLWACE